MKDEWIVIRPDVEPFNLIGFLYDSANAEELGEDMAEFGCGNDIIVHAGWYPECDPSGNYKLQIVKGMEVIAPSFCTTDVHALSQRMSEVAREYALKAELGGWQRVSDEASQGIWI